MSIIFKRKKKSIFPSFTSRTFANMLDITFFSIFIVPLMEVIKVYIYGEYDIRYYLQEVLSPILRKAQHPGIFRYIFTHPESLAFFESTHFFAKLCVEITISMSMMATIFIILWSKYSTTIGGAIISIKVVDAATKSHPSVKQCIIRVLCIPLSILPLGIGMFWAIFDKKKQTFHDKMSNIIVVNSNAKFTELTDETTVRHI